MITVTRIAFKFVSNILSKNFIRCKAISNHLKFTNEKTMNLQNKLIQLSLHKGKSSLHDLFN